MVKIISAIAVFLALWCVYQNLRINSLVEKNDALEAEKTTLSKTIKEYKKNEMEANNKISELRKKISVDKMALDWYNQSIPDSILKEIKK